MNTPHLRGCPNIDCHNNKDCCPFRKIVIPAVMGDDSEESPAAPENGRYRNALVEYEANGAMYIYASDGIFTKISMVAGGSGAASIQYVDGKIGAEATARQDGDADTLAAANAYTDAHSGTGDVTKQYVDDQDAATLASAKDYADDAVADSKNMTIFYIGQYYPEVGEQMPIYKDAEHTEQITFAEFRAAIEKGPVQLYRPYDYETYWIEYVDDLDVFLATPPSSGSYIYFKTRYLYGIREFYWYSENDAGPEYGGILDTQSDWNENNATVPSYIKNKPSLATVATSGLYSDLSGTPTVPTITLTTTDPGEGSVLAENAFIGVYN